MQPASVPDPHTRATAGNAQVGGPAAAGWARLLGYDLFISFALGPPPRGSRNYASDLARRLRERGFTVFFSEDEAPAGGELDDTLKRALHRSRVLVVVANRGTLADPRWVRSEVQEFRRRHPGRPVVPISMAGALQDPALADSVQVWLPFRDRIWIDECSEAAAADRASDDVVQRLVTTPHAVRSVVRLRAVVIGLIAFFAALALFAFAQKQQSDHNAAEAERQRIAAVQAQGEALTQAALAASAASAAQSAASAAETARAEEQKQRELAEQRLRTAQSRQLAAEGVADLPHRPDRTLALAAHAASVEPTIEAWRTLFAASARLSPELIGTLNGHSTAISALVLSADGQRLFSACVEGLIVAWDLKARRMIRSFHAGPRNALTTLAVRPDGRQLAVGSFEAQVLGWDVDTGRRVGETQPTEWPVAGLAYSQDGEWLHVDMPRGARLIASVDFTDVTRSARAPAVTPATRPRVEGSAGGPGLFRLYVGGHRTELRYDHRQLGQAVAYAVSTDGRVAALAHTTSLTRWELPRSGSTSPSSEPRLHRHLSKRDTELRAVALSADGRDLASGAEDGTIALHGARGERLGLLTGHTGAVSALVFTPDGRMLISAGADGAVMLWDVERAAQRQAWRPARRTPAAAAARSLLLRDRSGWQRTGPTWQVQMAEIGESAGVAALGDVGPGYPGPAVSSDDGYVAAVLGERLRVVPIALSPGAEATLQRGWERTLSPAPSINRLAVSVGGRHVAWVDENGSLKLVSGDRAEPLVSTPTPLPKPGREHDPPYRWTNLAFSADGRRLAWLTDDALQLFDANTGRRLLRWVDRGWINPRALAIAPRGDALAIVASDDLLYWREPFGFAPAAARRLPLELRARIGQIEFDDRGDRVHVQLYRGQFIVWQPDSGQAIEMPWPDDIERWRVSSDGQWIVARHAAPYRPRFLVAWPLGLKALGERACAVTHDWLAGVEVARLSPNTSERPPAMPSCRARPSAPLFTTRR